MKIYCDGALRLSFTDGSGHAIVSGGELRFFKDDGSENGSGSVCRIRLHAGALGPAEVAALDRGPAVLPVVISQPQSRAVNPGTTVVFDVAVGGRLILEDAPALAPHRFYRVQH